jgi:hypothetical protein
MEGSTALHFAADVLPFVSTFKKISDGRLPTLYVTDRHISSAPHDALKMIRLLIRHGADVTLRNADGKTALDRATYRYERALSEYSNHPEIVKVYELIVEELKAAELKQAITGIINVLGEAEALLNSGQDLVRAQSTIRAAKDALELLRSKSKSSSSGSGF